MCPRLKEIVLSNIESPLSADEVMEMVNSRQKSQGCVRRGDRQCSDYVWVTFGGAPKQGVINEVPPVTTDDHPRDMSKDDGLDDEIMIQ